VSSAISREDGSSLIWFINLIALITAVVLILSAAISQYQFANRLKLFADNYVLAAATIHESGQTLDFAKFKLSAAIEHFDIAKLELSMLSDDKTLEVVICRTWHSPIPLLQLDEQICERSRAR